jgi:segregation and condensation protein B
MAEIKDIIESLLFVSDQPITIDQVKTVLPDALPTDIRLAVNALAADYEARQGAIVLAEVAGGYQLRTRPEYADYIQKLIEPAPLKLSRPAMETLAIVAYQQPILRSEIEHIRGVNSGNTLRFLQEKKLIRVIGRRDVPGRPLVYGTTRKFLETFELKDLKDLPKPDELEADPMPFQKTKQSYEAIDLPLNVPIDVPDMRVVQPPACDRSLDIETDGEENTA